MIPSAGRSHQFSLCEQDERQIDFPAPFLYHEGSRTGPPRGRPNGKERIEMKDVMIWAGAGQIGMAIARRMGAG